MNKLSIIGKYQWRYLVILFTCCLPLSFVLAISPPNATPAISQQSSHIIQGQIVDDQGDIVIGATIRVQGVSGGTISDIDGKFSISVANSDVVLLVSFIGMKDASLPVTINASAPTNVKVILESDVESIDELVVIGYGEQKKESVVAAIASIDAADIVSTPTSNIVSGLAGKMPGLSVMIKDGELGSENIETLIRGVATTNNSEPLVLVDGVERSITDIDPYDVENVSILKDASATAVFGVRGANGVILVTTKKGIEGKPQISANVNYSVQNTTRQLEPMGAIDYMTTRNKVVDMYNDLTGTLTPIPYSDDVFENYANNVLPEYYVDRNFQEEFINKNVPMAKGNVNIRGGNEKTKYFASVGYLMQKGPFKTENWDEYNYDNEERLNRFTYRANIDMQFTSSLKGWLNISGSLQDKNDPMIYLNNNTSYYSLLMASLIDVPSISYPDLTPSGEVVAASGATRSAYGMLNRSGYRTTTNNKLNTTIGLQQNLDKITKGLSVKAQMSYDTNVTHRRGFGRTYQTYNQQLVETDNGSEVIYTVGESEDTELEPYLYQSFTNKFNLEISTNYKRKFAKRHDVTGLLLYKQNQKVVNASVPYNYVGLVGRATYGFDSKYLAEFNFGMNGSEQFAEGRRFGFFPSASVGWVMSEEDFVKNTAAVDFLKIRASFGQVGNDNMSNLRFLYLDDWAQGTGKTTWLYTIPKITGLSNYVYEKTMPNPYVTWEVANKYNVGVESRFFDVLQFDFDLFYERRTSILIDESPIPTFIFGQDNLPSTNDGVMTNRGFETTLSYSKSINKDLFLGARYSMSFARNKIESMNETPANDTYAYPYQTEGYSSRILWGYDCLGYFQDQSEIDGWADQTGLAALVAPGDLKYRDANEDGVIDVKDYVPMDHPTVPEFNHSLTLFGNYKGFDFNILFNVVHNYSYDIRGRGVNDWDGSAYNGIKNYFNHHADAWTPEKQANGEDYWYPRMYPDGISCSKQPSDFWVIDAWYGRLKNVELGYTLPKHVLERIGIRNIRLFVTGSNLVLIDNLPVKTIDPETKSSLSHPLYSTYNFGLNVSF